MFVELCEGLQRLGDGWAFAFMMVAIVVAVTRYQRWSKEQDLEIVYHQLRANMPVVISDEEGINNE